MDQSGILVGETGGRADPILPTKLERPNLGIK